MILLLGKKIDSIGNGKPNIWTKITVKGNNVFREIKADSTGSGRIDLYRYEENGNVYLQKRDENFDGKIDRIEEFDKDGNLIKESLDKITPDEFDFSFYEKNGLIQSKK